MSYVHAIDGLRETIKNFVEIDAVRFCEQLYDRDAHRAESGLLAVLQNGEEYARVLAEHLRRAEPVYWSPEMGDMLAQVGSSVPDWTLRISDLPTESGLAWFARPLPMGILLPIAGGKTVPMLLGGVLWGTVLFRTDASLGDGVRTLEYVRADAPDAERWVLYSPVVMLNGEPRLCGGSSWLEGESLQELAPHPDTLAQGDEFGTWAVTIGQWFAAMMALMEQRIVVTEQVRLGRTDRKRLAREGWAHEPTVRVVKLRRAARHERDQGKRDDDPVEWSCSWVVRGHWRQQACGPDWSERRPVFVLPHIKGDPSKPLHALTERVFEMVR